MAVTGFLYILLLFLCSFAAVTIFKLAKLGLDSLKAKPPEEDPEPKKSRPAEKVKPVYYIVEKKSTRRNYGAPREITFSDRNDGK